MNKTFQSVPIQRLPPKWLSPRLPNLATLGQWPCPGHRAIGPRPKHVTLIKDTLTESQGWEGVTAISALLQFAHCLLRIPAHHDALSLPGVKTPRQTTKSEEKIRPIIHLYKFSNPHLVCQTHLELFGRESVKMQARGIWTQEVVKVPAPAEFACKSARARGRTEIRLGPQGREAVRPLQNLFLNRSRNPSQKAVPKRNQVR